MYTNAPERYFKKLCEQNGLPRVSLHSLRHLNASLLISAGLDVKTVQASLGHSSATTTLDSYAHEFQMAQAITSAAVTNALERTIAS
jgi:integrase